MLLVDSWTSQNLSAEEASSRAPMAISHTRLVRPSSDIRMVCGLRAAAISAPLRLVPSCAVWHGNSNVPLHWQLYLHSFQSVSKQRCDVVAGKEVYVDVQGWHLFLKEITVEKDVKMHQARTTTLKGNRDTACSHYHACICLITLPYHMHSNIHRQSVQSSPASRHVKEPIPYVQSSMGDYQMLSRSLEHTCRV